MFFLLKNCEVSDILIWCVICVIVVGEFFLVLVGFVYFVICNVIRVVRKDYFGSNVDSDVFEFSLFVMVDKVKSLCGFDNVEYYLLFVLKLFKIILYGKLVWRFVDFIWRFLV